MEILLIAAVIGLIPAAIAKGKGYSFGLWWLYGAAFFIVALPHSLIMKANAGAIEQQQISEGMKKCIYCAEFIKGDANVCRYCGRDVRKKCPHCDESIKEGANFCPHCGRDVNIAV